MSNEVIAAWIGAGSALLVVIIKDIIITWLSQRSDLKRQLITQRIEKIYAPLDHLLYLLETSDQKKKAACEEIRAILKQYGYLLTEKTLSGFYILTDGDDAVISDTTKRFIQEYKQLRTTFYNSYASAQNIEVD
jgi:pantothenate kinase